MTVDFAKYTICSPSGRKLQAMYEVLWELFPYDRPVYDEMMQTGKSFYTLKNYALYQGGEFLGNVGLMPMEIRLEGRIVELMGIGAVATVPQHRRKGIATYLMEHCMSIIDARRLPSALFTELPVMYDRHGFEVVPQKYFAADMSKIVFKGVKHRCKILSKLDEGHLAMMAEIYDDQYPVYDGKLVRNKQYWQLYQMLFNPYPKPHVFFCYDHSDCLAGYVRFEMESDRFTITEFCAPEGNWDVIESSFSVIQDLAIQNKITLFSFALPAEHFLFDALRHKGAVLFAEPGGVRREIFMVRPACGWELGALGNLQWSLADKF